MTAPLLGTTDRANAQAGAHIGIEKRLVDGIADIDR